MLINFARKFLVLIENTECNLVKKAFTTVCKLAKTNLLF